MGNCTGHSKQDAHNEFNNKLLIKTSTWVRDSHELFDYESPHLMKKTFKIHNLLSGIQRHDNEITMVTDDMSGSQHGHHHHRFSFHSSSKSHSASKDKSKKSQSHQKISEELIMLSKLDHQPITFINQHSGIYTVFDLPHQYNHVTQRSVILKKDDLVKIQSELHNSKNNSAPQENNSESKNAINSWAMSNNNEQNKIPQQQLVLDYDKYLEQQQSNGVFSKISSCQDKELLNELNQDQNRLWLIVRYLTVEGKTNQFQLTGGETIKLGRVKFIIREIHVNADDDNQTNYCDNSFEANLQDDSGGYESPGISDQQHANNRRSNISGHLMPTNRVVRLRSQNEDDDQSPFSNNNQRQEQQQQQSSHNRLASQESLPRPRRQIQAINNQITNLNRDSIEDYKSAESGNRIMIDSNNNNNANSSRRIQEVDFEEEKKMHSSSVKRFDINQTTQCNRLSYNNNHTNQNNRNASRSQHYDLRGLNQGQFQDTLICLSQEEQRIRDSLMGFDPNQEFHGSQGIDPASELFDQQRNAGGNGHSQYIREDHHSEDEVIDDEHYEEDLIKNIKDHHDMLEQSFASEKDKEELHKTMYSNKDASSENNNLCRICFSELFNEQNPLISPCKCAGSMKYIHLLCLRTWLQRKENVKTSSNVTSYSWRAFHCELCKSEYSDKINVDGTQYWIFEIQKPKTNYLVLESLTLQNPNGQSQPVQQNNNSKTLHILNLNQKNVIKIGRGHDNDLRVADISVSRCHAFIKRDPKGYMYLEDNSSKFGTLVMIKAPLILNVQMTYYIQAGRTIMKLHLQPEWSILGGIMKSSILSQNQINNNQHRKQSSMDKTSQIAHPPIKRKASNTDDIFYQTISRFCNNETMTLIKAFVSDLKKLRAHQLVMNENLVGSQTPTPRQLIHSLDQSFSENIPEEKEDLTIQQNIKLNQETLVQSLITGQQTQSTQVKTTHQMKSLQSQDLSGINNINEELLSPQSRIQINGKIQEIKTNSFQIKLTSLKDKFSNEKIRSHQTIKGDDDEIECEQWLHQRGKIFLSQNSQLEENKNAYIVQQNIASQKIEDQLLLQNFRSVNQSKEDFFKDNKVLVKNMSSVKTPPSFTRKSAKQSLSIMHMNTNKLSAVQKAINNQVNCYLEEVKQQQVFASPTSTIQNRVNASNNKNASRIGMTNQHSLQSKSQSNKMQNASKTFSPNITSQYSKQKSIMVSPVNHQIRQSIDDMTIKEEGNRVSQLTQKQLILSQNQRILVDSNNPEQVVQSNEAFLFNQIKLPNTTNNISNTLQKSLIQGQVPSKVVKSNKHQLLNKNHGSNSSQNKKNQIQTKLQQDMLKQNSQQRMQIRSSQLASQTKYSK